MRQGLVQIGCFLVSAGLSVSVMAKDATHENLAPGFKFQKNESLLRPRLSSTLDNPNDSNSTRRLLSPEAKKDSYDAIFYYPLHRRGVSIDVGVNLRIQEEQASQSDQRYSYQQDWLSIDPSETETLFHAAAVFDLPFNGFQAGISGTYNADLTNSEYDYQAKLSYKWKSGLGLEGGWQHQQKSYDQQNLDETLDVQTLFIDMNYRF